ncbi:protein kinase domain-containing protein [Kribbella sp. CA-293567]|uniref:protein kinase domain-containing protein n=1 Tax=Kribbella sp. CA-293567 TaxID=3002436 RepID=UPI0022DE00A5|nr:protein kinase [Kribbella sp. CA-293567]WBQ07276.1 protein kinase [Kribbella sp. CA-293567]
MEAFAGRYRLIDLVGTGGMGSVWRAWDLRREGYVAAKVLGQHDAATLLRFVREQSLRIEHRHVVAPHGWAADDDKVVFAMDLVRGGSVATLLGDHGPLPESYVAVLVDQLLHGLSAVHAAGIVHRDLKPANLLLDPTGTATPRLRLSDFGIAGLLDEPRMTRHSTVLGTPGYLAPEQLAGADPDPRQDLYTVGAVAAELLTGERPDIQGNLPTGESGAFWELIRLLTAQDPAGRPESAAAAGRLLAATNLVPSPGATPWTTQPDPPEVFDHLPPLPTGWTSSGPATASARSGTAASTGWTSSGPATATAHGGTAASTGWTSSGPATATAHGGTAASAAHGGTAASAAGAAPSSVTPSPAPTPTAASAFTLAPTPAAPPNPITAPNSITAPVVPDAPTAAARSAPTATNSAAPITDESPQVSDFADKRASSRGRNRGLLWVAIGSFTGATVLLAGAIWLLLR